MCTNDINYVRSEGKRITETLIYEAVTEIKQSERSTSPTLRILSPINVVTKLINCSRKLTQQSKKGI